MAKYFFIFILGFRNYQVIYFLEEAVLAGESPKKKTTLRERFNTVRQEIRSLTWKDTKGALRLTFNDLFKNKGRGKEFGLMLLSTIIIPGGTIGYGFYRLHAWRKQQAVNDNSKPLSNTLPRPPQP